MLICFINFKLLIVIFFGFILGIIPFLAKSYAFFPFIFTAENMWGVCSISPINLCNIELILSMSGIIFDSSIILPVISPVLVLIPN